LQCHCVIVGEIFEHGHARTSDLASNIRPWASTIDTFILSGGLSYAPN
jgi:hypothetical protein